VKYVLVDNNNQEVISTAELASNVGLSGAKTYFVGIKKIEEKEFNKLWKVYPIQEWNNIQHAYQRPSSSDPNRAWWNGEESYLDLEKT
jgi:hypothetical protein|tara:strand:+ start:212 stop:475 length:264 start_codon:yes stop_codon:yes gene_type:complete